MNPSLGQETATRGEHTMLVAGYGKLPKATSVEQVHQVLALVAVVDARSGLVVEASTTLLVPVADRFICGLLTGLSLPADGATFIENVTARYHGHAQRAVLAAFRDLLTKYQEAMQDLETTPSSTRLETEIKDGGA